MIKRIAVAFVYVTTIFAFVTIAAAPSAAASASGIIKGSVTCSDDIPLTGLRIYAGTGEVAVPPLKHINRGVIYKNNSRAEYEVAMSTITAGTKVVLYVWCNGSPAGGREWELTPRNDKIWWISLDGCGPRKRVC